MLRENFFQAEAPEQGTVQHPESDGALSPPVRLSIRVRGYTVSV